MISLRNKIQTQAEQNREEKNPMKMPRLKYYAHNTRHLIFQQKSIMNWIDRERDEFRVWIHTDIFFFFVFGSSVLAIYLRYGSHINRPTHGTACMVRDKPSSHIYTHVKHPDEPVFVMMTMNFECRRFNERREFRVNPHSHVSFR